MLNSVSAHMRGFACVPLKLRGHASLFSQLGQIKARTPPYFSCSTAAYVVVCMALSVGDDGMLDITVKTPNVENRTFTLRIEASASISDLKIALSNSHPGRPAPQDQTVCCQASLITALLFVDEADPLNSHVLSSCMLLSCCMVARY